MTRRTSRSIGALACLLAAVALIAVEAATVGAKPKPTPAPSKPDSGTVYTATTYNSGGFTYAAGNNTDRLFGASAVTFKIKILPGNASGTLNLNVPAVTFFYSNGSLSGTGSATLTIPATGPSTVTNGKLSLTNGAGARKGHTFKATFSGTGNASTGIYKFIYAGTYK